MSGRRRTGEERILCEPTLTFSQGSKKISFNEKGKKKRISDLSSRRLIIPLHCSRQRACLKVQISCLLAGNIIICNKTEEGRINDLSKDFKIRTSPGALTLLLRFTGSEWLDSTAQVNMARRKILIVARVYFQGLTRVPHQIGFG